jgi:hypothetical protein
MSYQSNSVTVAATGGSGSGGNPLNIVLIGEVQGSNVVLSWSSATGSGDEERLQRRVAGSGLAFGTIFTWMPGSSPRTYADAIGGSGGPVAGTSYEYRVDYDYVQ